MLNGGEWAYPRFVADFNDSSFDFSLNNMMLPIVIHNY